MIIENGDDDEIINAFNMVTPDDLVKWRKNLAKVPPAVYVHTNESEELAEAIGAIMSCRSDIEGD